MQYNININQKALIEFSSDLDLKDAAILDFILKAKENPFFETKIFNEKEYFWLSYSKIIEELPLLKIKNKNVLARKLRKLIDLGLLESYIDQSQGNKTYWKTGSNFYKLLFEGVSTQKSGGIYSKVERVSTQKSNNNNTNITTTSDYLNFELDDTRKSILASKGFDLALYELELLNWRDYIKTLQIPPTNLTSSFTNWCLNVVAQHTRTNKALDKTKTKEEIYQESLETGEWSDIWQNDNETVEEFEERVEARQNLTGSRYRKHYTNSISNLVKI